MDFWICLNLFQIISPAAGSLSPFDIKLLLSAPKGSSICHSHNVCIPWWILICRLVGCVRKASSWPLCLSGLNCLITVIIWTGSRITWHPDTMLALLTCTKKRALKHWVDVAQVSRGWMKMPAVWSTGLWCIYTHTQDSLHACTVYPLACMWIPNVSRTFRCYQMKKLHVRASVPSEEGPGAVWLIYDSPHALCPGSPCSVL